jgi:hypothetical protein
MGISVNKCYGRSSAEWFSCDGEPAAFGKTCTVGTVAPPLGSSLRNSGGQGEFLPGRPFRRQQRQSASGSCNYRRAAPEALEAGGACHKGNWRIATAPCSDGAEHGVFIVTEVRLTFLITENGGIQTQQSWVCLLADPTITVKDAPLCPEDFPSGVPFSCARVS